MNRLTRLWRRVLAGCLSHEPIKVLVKGKLRFQCESCHEDLGAILPGQKYRQRKVKPAKLKLAEKVTPMEPRKRA